MMTDTLDPRCVSVTIPCTVRKSHGYDHSAFHFEVAGHGFTILLDKFAREWAAAGVQITEGDELLLTIELNKIIHTKDTPDAAAQ